MDYMKLFMDSDCLIKLTKSGIEPLVENHFNILIPEIVEKEVVHEGKKRNARTPMQLKKILHVVALGFFKCIQPKSQVTKR